MRSGWARWPRTRWWRLPDVEDHTRRIRRDFDEVPGLDSTVKEAASFWRLDAATCADVLDGPWDVVIMKFREPHLFRGDSQREAILASPAREA